MKILITGEYISAAKHSSRNKRKKTSRNITDHMVRCRSSNIWSYAYDIENGENVGTMYVQFKNSTGGPGDIYRYYEVPLKIYRKFVAAPSKGHSHWKYIRHKYLYSKLTGDKTGKLQNAVN
jgi:hypothetical protein